jgi:hypothetical protein
MREEGGQLAFYLYVGLKRIKCFFFTEFPLAAVMKTIFFHGTGLKIEQGGSGVCIGGYICII